MANAKGFASDSEERGTPPATGINEKGRAVGNRSFHWSGFFCLEFNL